MYYITYKNNGKSEKTAKIDDYEKAKKTKEFLKFQGVTNIKINKYKG